jgi:hypothetical protein
MLGDFQNENADRIRSPKEVARRCIVLFAVLAAGHGESREKLVAWLRREGLWDAVSSNESGFLLSGSPTKQQYVDATWRAEALYCLVWALGLIDEAPDSLKACDIQLLQRQLPPLFGSVGGFISSAKLRSDLEIRAANESIYQIHWRVRDAQLKGQPPIESYNPSVIQEGHYALNWLIGYCGQAWDDVTTNT